MSLVTRCPACSTMFKVVPDQIRIAAGWVRCGHCNEVFHAPAHMLPYEQLPGAVAPPPQMPPPGPAPMAPAPATAPAPAVTPDAWADGDEHDTVPDLLSEFMPVDGDPILASGPGLKEPWLPPADAPVRMDFRALDSRLADASWPLDDRLGEALGLPAKRTTPSFVARAERRAFWSSRPVRALLWLASLVLLVSLVLQVALSNRDWLAARLPQLKPALQALCARIGCQVQPYRPSGAVVIDGNGPLYLVSPGNFRVSFTLRNTLDMPVASPALELTLVNAQQQTVVRRVVTAAEIGAPPVLAARGEFSGVSALTVNNLPLAESITGYGVLAFYP